MPYYLRSDPSKERFANVWVGFPASENVMVNGQGKKKTLPISGNSSWAINSLGDIVGIPPLSSGISDLLTGQIVTQGQVELVIHNLYSNQTKTIKQLDRPVGIHSLKWSPDNQYIAYHESRLNEQGRVVSRATVVLNSQDGSEVLRQPLSASDDPNKNPAIRSAWFNASQFFVLQTTNEDNMPSDILWRLDIHQKKAEKLCSGHVNIQMDPALQRPYSKQWTQRGSLPTSDCMQPYLSSIAKIFGSLEYPVPYQLSSFSEDDRYYFYDLYRECVLLPKNFCRRWVIEAYDRQTGKIYEVHEIRKEVDTL